MFPNVDQNTELLSPAVSRRVVSATSPIPVSGVVVHKDDDVLFGVELRSGNDLVAYYGAGSKTGAQILLALGSCTPAGRELLLQY